MFKWNFQYFNFHCIESVTSFCTPFHQIFVFIDKIPWALLSPGCLPSLPWGMLLALGQLFHQCLCWFFFIPYTKLLFNQSAYSTHWCMGLLLVGAGLCISSYRFFWGIPQLISPACWGLPEWQHKHLMKHSMQLCTLSTLAEDIPCSII